MDSSAFLTALSKALKKNQGMLPGEVRAGTWTRFMQGCLIDLADASKMHVCARGLGRLPSGKVDEDRHMSKEFLYDFTMYANDDWEPWSLPSIIIEHENLWTPVAFFQDFWKLLVGFAPLRVMFGYSGTADGVADLVNKIGAHEAESCWAYPAATEDLVLLRCPDGGMPWPTWKVIHRPAGKGWTSPADVKLDGSVIRV
jgi:hypothetical protein